MKKFNSTVLMILLLVIVSLAIYIFQLVKFQSPQDTVFYFLQDMAFLPLQVAIVTIVLGKFLTNREKKERLKKTNMMVGAFFSEIGNELLEKLNRLNSKSEELELCLNFIENWSNRDFKTAATSIEKYDLDICCTADDLQNLKNMLSEKRNFILLMLENPNLLEHETFTDLLWAIFHLTDELLFRGSFADLPSTDIAHLNNDTRRAFKAILVQWISYMFHLKSDYPYLFSLEMRRNPFNVNKTNI